MNQETQQSLNIGFSVDEEFDSERFIKLRLKVCHEGVCRKNYYFSQDTIDDAAPTITNIPILANVLFDEVTGQPYFGGHDMSLEDDKVDPDKIRLVYKETPIGLIPETCNYTVEEIDGVNYVFVDAYVWKEYSNYAEDVVLANPTIKLSMEIIILQYTYNSDDDRFSVDKYKYQGITLLGDQWTTGMENACATVVNFSNEKDLMLTMMEELKKTLMSCDNEINKEGGCNSLDTTLGNAKVNEETVIPEPFTEEVKVGETAEGEVNSATEEVGETSTTENFTEETTVGATLTSTEDTSTTAFTLTFTLSHEDIRTKLYAQLNARICEESEEGYRYTYIVEVFDNYFVFEESRDGVTKYYRNNYTITDNEVTIDADRVEVWSEFLTDEEKKVLDNMRQDYESLKSEVEELRAYKNSVLQAQYDTEKAEVFSQFEPLLKDVADYEELKASTEQFTIDELKTKCFALLGQKTAQFSMKTKDKSTEQMNVRFSLSSVDVETPTDDYGGLLVNRNAR